MQWELLAALAIAIPVTIFPVAFIWYLNIGGIVHAVREARQTRTAGKKAIPMAKGTC